MNIYLLEKSGKNPTFTKKSFIGVIKIIVLFGMCPELMCGGVHSDDSLKVFKELNEAVEEVVEIYKRDGKFLPLPKALVLQSV